MDLLTYGIDDISNILAVFVYVLDITTVSLAYFVINYYDKLHIGRMLISVVRTANHIAFVLIY